MAIVSIEHKGLKQLFQDGNRRGVPAAFADKLERITVIHFTSLTPSMRSTWCRAGGCTP